MYSNVQKAKENKAQTIANGVLPMQSAEEFALQFVDNRTETIGQRKLQEMMNNTRTVNLEKPKENKSRATANSVAQEKKDNQGFEFVDNRPEAISQRKLYDFISGDSSSIANVTIPEGYKKDQKIITGNIKPIQCMKLKEVDMKLQSNTGFLKFIADKIGIDNIFSINDDVDYPGLEEWILEFTKIGSKPKMEQEVEAAPTGVSHDGAHVSFNTNIDSGINGKFNLWYYKSLNVIDVDVKLLVSEKMTDSILSTLREVEEFWTNKFFFENTTSHEKIRVDINVIPVSETNDFHFKYGELSGEVANPSVIRSGRSMRARSTKEDREQKKPQISAFHEFGHTIGLGEDYNLDTEKKGSHHFAMLSGPEQRDYDDSIEDNVIPDSIMGTGKQLRKYHYQPILVEFRKMIPEKERQQWVVSEKKTE